MSWYSCAYKLGLQNNLGCKQATITRPCKANTCIRVKASFFVQF